MLPAYAKSGSLLLTHFRIMLAGAAAELRANPAVVAAYLRV